MSTSVTGATIAVGLDATVYCDCFEKGRVRTPPPQPALVYVEPSGQVALKWDEPQADQHSFYGWLAECCEHGPMGELVSHRLGNLTLIAFLRGLLAERPAQFPILVTKVICDGTHAGDHLTLDEVDRLAGEVELLKNVRGDARSEEELIRQFERQMSELVQAARHIRKPIAF
jgi:hypothetical protein